MSTNTTIRILKPLDSQDECSYLTELSRHNVDTDRHHVLITAGWRHMGDRYRGYVGNIKRIRYYANLDFDNPCLTFTQTEAWYITLYMLAFAHGAISYVTYTPEFWRVWYGTPWYMRVKSNLFAD